MIARRRVGAIVLALVLLPLVIAGLAMHAAWVVKEQAVVARRAVLGAQRASQLARAAVAEAFSRIDMEANRPRPRSAERPEAIQVDWFRALRPPVRACAAPSMGTVSIECPRAAALATANGFALGPVVARVVGLRVDEGAVQGVIESTAVLEGVRGRSAASHRLVERRLYYSVRTDQGAEGAAPVHEIIVVRTPLGRDHHVR